MNDQDLKKLYIEHLGEVIQYKHGKFGQRVKRLPQYQSTTNRKFVGRREEPTQDPDKIWFWSDHHFGHKNIIKYSNRPFADVYEMQQRLISTHNQYIGKDDVVYILGDITFLNEQLSNQIIDQLNGYKVLIAGNHDYVKKKLKQYHVDRESLCEMLFVDGFQFALTHFPMDNLPQNTFNIHGHTHTVCSLNPQHINVSVEVLDYIPITLTDIINIATERKNLL